MADKMTSKHVFRNECRDEDIEQISSVASRDASIVISSLKTFSCESDIELIDSFDSQRCFEIDSENGTIHIRSQDKRKTNSKQQQDYYLQPPIVTPPKPFAAVVDISLDLLPETQLDTLLLYAGSDDQKIPSEKELGLLFPTTDPGCLTKTTRECKTPLISKSNHKNHHNARIENDGSVMCNPCETYVYKHLWSSLPLPGSFGPIICLLLHMELSSMIHETVVKQACEIVNKQWKHGSHGLFSSKISNERDIQKISGKIVDKLVDTLGPIVDLPVLFQVSAHTYNNLGTAEDDRLSIFFRKELNESETETEEIELQVIGDNESETETEEIELQVIGDVATKSCASDASTDCECTSGQKRKGRTSDNSEEDKISSKNRTEFVPTVLQLAIAYGAKYSMIDNGLSKSSQTSLEDFVKKTSSQLQCVNPIERKKKWNSMMETWHDQGRTS